MYAPVHETTPEADFGHDIYRLRPGPMPFEVVAVAASAGGLHALQQLLAVLPDSFPCPLVIAHHLPSVVMYRSVLDKILQSHTSLKVKWAEDGEILRAGHILIAPQDHHLQISPDRSLVVVPAEMGTRFRPAADPLFMSVAANCGERGIAVVLSGGLFDGAQGAYEVASAGGRVLVQSCETAHVPQMPLAAMRTGAVDFAFSPELIARALVTLVMAPGAAAWFRVWHGKELRRPAR